MTELQEVLDNQEERIVKLEGKVKSLDMQMGALIDRKIEETKHNDVDRHNTVTLQEYHEMRDKLSKHLGESVRIIKAIVKGHEAGYVHPDLLRHTKQFLEMME